MLKGTQRRMIVVRSPDPRLFEEAIFILRDDILHMEKGSQEDILRQARRAAEEYTRAHCPRGRLGRLSAPLLAALGAGLTGVAWLLARILGVLVA